MMNIIEINKDKRVDDFFAAHWGADFIVSKGEKLYGHELDGFGIVDEDEILYLLTYHVKNDECEIVSLDSSMRNQGIGTDLIKKMIEKASSIIGLKRLWLMTTNDNLDALRFYQKRGFVLTAVYPDAIEASRKLGQMIPKIGDYGIPIRDEIEMDYSNLRDRKGNKWKKLK
jgi:GNAT superfamily N-acetyltransferase